MNTAHPHTRATNAPRHRARFAAHAVALVGLSMLALPAAAADWVARHGLTSAQYQNAFEDFNKKGFRLKSISGYDSGGARYAALWSKAPGPAQAARHGLNPQQYQAAFYD